MLRSITIGEGPVKDGNEIAGEVVAYVSRSEPDYQGESLDPKGWVFDHYNRIVSWNHGRELDLEGAMPIAELMRDPWTDQDGLLFHYRYFVEAPGRLGEIAQTLAFLEFKQGMDHSVMFEPLEWKNPDGKKASREYGDLYPGAMKGRVYLKQGLVEGGPVFIGANPGARTVVAKAFVERGLPLPAGIEAQDPIERIVRPVSEQMRERDAQASQQGAGQIDQSAISAGFRTALRRMESGVRTELALARVREGFRHV